MSPSAVSVTTTFEVPQALEVSCVLFYPLIAHCKAFVSRGEPLPAVVVASCVTSHELASRTHLGGVFAKVPRCRRNHVISAVVTQPFYCHAAYSLSCYFAMLCRSVLGFSSRVRIPIGAVV